MDKVFPADYPANLLELIIQDGAKENTINDVYRVANNGNNDIKAYLSTYLTQIEDGSYCDRDLSIMSESGQIDIGQYSTSFTSSEKKAKKLLQVMEKHYDGPILLKGVIKPEYGYSMMTKDSVSKRRSDRFHIDWWMYDKADPSDDFHIVEKKEE